MQGLEFIRTTSGLANQHLLFGVDYIVYVEGGRYDRSVVEISRDGSDETVDASFWNSVFQITRPNKSFHIKSVGNKSTVFELAITLCRADVKSAVCCVDSDLSAVLNKYTVEPKLVKTWGYSWENDVCNDFTVENMYRRLRGNSARTAEIAASLKEWLNKFCEELKPYIVIDVDQICSGKNGLFDRNRPASCFSSPVQTLPEVQSQRLDLQIHPCSADHVRIIDGESIDPIRHVFGKTLIKAVYKAVQHFAPRSGGGRIDFDVFQFIIVDLFAFWLQNNEDRKAYYDQQIVSCGI